MELDKKDICKIIDGEPDRIEHVKLKKYAEEEYAESAYRVKVDGDETKYCWCAICKMVYSADKKHLMGNIRTHWNGHRSRKRVVQNTMDNFVSKKSKFRFRRPKLLDLGAVLPRLYVKVLYQFLFLNLLVHRPCSMEYKVSLNFKS